MGHLQQGTTLLQALHRFVECQPNKPLFHFLNDSGEVCDALTYEELDLKSSNLAGVIESQQGLGLSKGDRVLLVYPSSLDFIVAFIACLKAGVIAVPVFPPDPNRLKKDLQHFTTIQQSSGATTTLTSRNYNYAVKMGTIKNLFTLEWPNMKWFETDSVFASAVPTTSPVQAYNPALNDVAFLQYTSGSTSEPKGVMITHGNLTHNLQLIVTGLRAVDDTIVVSWLPQFHDMGLIGSYLGVIYCGGSGYYMSPFSFIKQPCVWVQCMDRYRATHVQAPNFAYGLTARKYSAMHKERRPRFDLSCVRHMINAAEPVDGVTMDTFYAVFEPCGLRRGVVYPTYGLAEHTVYVCSNGTHRVTVDRDKLELEGIVREVDKMILWVYSEKEGRGGPEEGTKVSVLIGCGNPAESVGVDLRIVDVSTCGNNNGVVSGHALEEERVGEIWIKSPSCAAGYWGLQDKSIEDFHARVEGQEGGYMRTGDLGFLHEGELYICGRLKDMMIIRGRNHFPQDIERTCESACSDELRGGCSAAFSISIRSIETMVIVAELKEGVIENFERIADTMKRAVLSSHGVAVHSIHLLTPRSIPKTTSGKIARAWCKRALQQGTLQIVYSTTFGGPSDADVNFGGFQASAEEEEKIDEDAVNPTALSHEEIVSKIVTAIAAAMKVDQSSLPVDVPLSSLGLDSMDMFAVMGNLSRKFTVSVSEEVLFEADTTVNTIAQVLRDGGVYEAKPLMVEAYRVMDAARKLKEKSVLRLDERTRKQLIAECSVKSDLQARTGGFADGYAQQHAPISAADEFLVMAFFLVVMSALFWVPMALILSFIVLPISVAATVWAVLLLISYFAPVRAWPPAGRFSRLGVAMQKYFSYRVIFDRSRLHADTQTPTIIAGYPHGVLPIGHILQVLAQESIFGTNFHGVGASAIFLMPIYGHVFKMLGIEDASRNNLVKVLGEKRRSIGLVPGGIAEIFKLVSSKPDEEVVVLNARKGFIKLALQTGATILPCYLFGNTQIFHLLSNSFFAAISRAIKASVTGFWGRYFLAIPFRVPILGVMGHPIHCVKVDDPPEEMVNEYHAVYVEELTRIFETYKSVYGWQHKRLVIT